MNLAFDFQRMKNELGVTVDKRDLGDDPTYPGEGVKLPPVILASLGNDPAKKTVSGNPSASCQMSWYIFLNP